jgi:hypothetical protein
VDYFDIVISTGFSPSTLSVVKEWGRIEHIFDLIWSTFGMISRYLSIVRIAILQLDGHDKVAANLKAPQRAAKDNDCINFDLWLETFFF